MFAEDKPKNNKTALTSSQCQGCSISNVLSVYLAAEFPSESATATTA